MVDITQVDDKELAALIAAKWLELQQAQSVYRRLKAEQQRRLDASKFYFTEYGIIPKD